jgi:hypothetical protein
MEAWNSRGAVCSGERAASVRGLVRDRWDQADLSVEHSEVEPVDVLGDGNLEVVDALPRPEVADQLGLNSELNASAMALS